MYVGKKRPYATRPGGTLGTFAAIATATSNAATAPTIPAIGTTYRFHVYASETVVGTSCSGNPSIAVNVTWQDPNEASPLGVTIVTYTITTNGILGRIVPVLTQPYITFRAKAGTVVQYATTYTNGTSCAPNPQVQIYPTLEQM